MKKLPIIFIVLLFALPAWATDYYISSTSATSCTENFGTNVVASPSACVGQPCGRSEACPKYWSGSSDIIGGQSLAAGDNVYFKKGETFNRTGNNTSVIAQTGGSNGTAWTAGNYVYIGSYGTGAKPIISCCLDLVARSWVADGTNYKISTAAGTFSATDAAKIVAVWVDGVALRPRANTSLSAQEFYVDKTAGAEVLYVRLTGDVSPATKTSVIVNQCIQVIYSNKTFRQYDGLDIRYGQYGVNPYVATQKITNNDIGPVGTGVNIEFADYIVSGNYIHDCWIGQKYGDGTNTYGVYVSAAASDNPTITRNWIENAYTAIIFAAAADVDGGLVAYNVVKDPRINGIDFYGGGGTAAGTVNVLHNLVLFSPPELLGHGVAIRVGAGYITFKNNIVVVTATNCTVGLCDGLQYDTRATNITMNNNIYYAISPEDNKQKALASYNGSSFVEYTDIAAWRTATSQDSASVLSDPLLSSMANCAHAYAMSCIPRAGSPATNAGLDVCATLIDATDMAGKPVCAGGVFVGVGSAPDIGAYERRGIILQ